MCVLIRACFICVLILLYVCPHTLLVCVSLYYYMCVLIRVCVCFDTTICVLELLHMCPGTAAYVSILIYVCLCEAL